MLAAAAAAIAFAGCLTSAHASGCEYNTPANMDCTPAASANATLFTLPDTLSPTDLYLQLNGVAFAELSTFEAPIVVRAAGLLQAAAWNCVAAYSDRGYTDALRPTHAPVLGYVPAALGGVPLHTSDARALCVLNAFGTLFPKLLPRSVGALQAFVDGNGLSGAYEPSRGFEQDICACWDQEYCLAALAACDGWSPIFVGGAIGRAVHNYGTEDGYNSEGDTGVDGTPCTANCRPFRDTTGYFPISFPGKRKNADHWQPLLEDDGTGFFLRQEHVTPHIGSTAKLRVLESIDDRLADDPHYDYDLEADLVLRRLAALDDLRKVQVEFFDNKLNIARQIPAELSAKHPQVTFEQLVHFSVGATAVEYDTTVTAWKEKIRFDYVRTTTVIQRRGDDYIYTYAGPFEGARPIKARDFQPYIRIMPHAEFPSGSACLCTGVWQFVDGYLQMQFADDGSLPFHLHYPAGASFVEPGVVPAADVDITFSNFEELRDACAQSRLDGGQHFTEAIFASNHLCDGIGTEGVAYILSLSAGAPLPPSF